MQPFLDYLQSPKFFGLLVFAAGVALMATGHLGTDKALTLATALAGLFRVAAAVDNHAAATTAAASPAPAAPAIPSAALDALAAFADAMQPKAPAAAAPSAQPAPAPQAPAAAPQGAA